VCNDLVAGKDGSHSLNASSPRCTGQVLLLLDNASAAAGEPYQVSNAEQAGEQHRHCHHGIAHK